MQQLNKIEKITNMKNNFEMQTMKINNISTIRNLILTTVSQPLHILHNVHFVLFTQDTHINNNCMDVLYQYSTGTF